MVWLLLFFFVFLSYLSVGLLFWLSIQALYSIRIEIGQPCTYFVANRKAENYHRFKGYVKTLPTNGKGNIAISNGFPYWDYIVFSISLPHTKSF
jgi:hypothetical protein